MLFEAGARQNPSGMFIYYFSKGYWNIFGAARVCVFLMNTRRKLGLHAQN
jgi:hypothetical protein